MSSDMSNSYNQQSTDNSSPTRSEQQVVPLRDTSDYSGEYSETMEEPSIATTGLSVSDQRPSVLLSKSKWKNRRGKSDVSGQSYGNIATTDVSLTDQPTSSLVPKYHRQSRRGKKDSWGEHHGTNVRSISESGWQSPEDMRTTSNSETRQVEGLDSGNRTISDSGFSVVPPPIALDRGQNNFLVLPGAVRVGGAQQSSSSLYRSAEMMEDHMGDAAVEPVLVQAQKVDEVYATETISLSKQQKEEKRRRRKLFLFCGVLSCSFIGVMIAVILVFALPPQTAPQSLSLSPSSAPSFSRTEMEAYVRTLSSSDAFRNGNSAQSRALDWLLNIDLTTGGQSEVTQRYVLATLFFSANGASWESNSDWLSTKSVCEWFTSGSAICGGDGLLQELNLSRNNLSGSLPIEIGHLANQLKVLDLTFNELTGTLPSELGRLSHVEVLHLSINRLQSTIPSDMGHLTSVVSLYFDGNNLTGDMPSEICQLKNDTLEKLWADCANVTCPEGCCRCCSVEVPCTTS